MSMIEDAIFKALDAAKPGGSIDPSEAARILDPEKWQRKFKSIRAEAVRLAKAGRLVILRKGKPVDPDDFKGVYRLQACDAPPSGETDGAAIGTPVEPRADTSEATTAQTSSAPEAAPDPTTEPAPDGS